MDINPSLQILDWYVKGMGLGIKGLGKNPQKSELIHWWQCPPNRVPSDSEKHMCLYTSSCTTCGVLTRLPAKTHKKNRMRVKTLANQPSQQKFAGLYGIRCELVKQIWDEPSIYWDGTTLGILRNIHNHSFILKLTLVSSWYKNQSYKERFVPSASILQKSNWYVQKKKKFNCHPATFWSIVKLVMVSNIAWNLCLQCYKLAQIISQLSNEIKM